LLELERNLLLIAVTSSCHHHRGGRGVGEHQLLNPVSELISLDLMWALT
jgi:hypothetical protein